MVLFIGKETRLFEDQVKYHAYFSNVEGLSEESPVWLGGLEVGRVTGIAFAPGADAKNHRIEVSLQVAKKYADRVRADSVVRLSSLGVLGEKAVDITLGNPQEPAVAPDSELPTVPSG
ncbi:MlaD family protein, partial [Stigmatella aurantiaca]|uniref:MlaD family protein n=1 Tax=Stigmatella aurantiaca TaxID=41 RepID=UPI001E55B06D